MWFLRRILRIAWTDKVSNEEVLQRANTSRHLMKIIVNRQIRFVGHIMRKSQLEAIALTGMIKAKELEVDKWKRLWTGCHSLVGNNGKSMTYWKSVKIVMNILTANVRVWHGTYRTLDWIRRYSILILMRDIDIAILSVCLSVCLSVRYFPVFYRNDLTYCHSFSNSW